MTTLNIYLNFAGNAEEAFAFYRSIFGGEFTSLGRFRDMPMEGISIPEEDQGKIMHIATCKHRPCPDGLRQHRGA